ncbi:MAG: metallophosphoesterase [Candidatus Bathyarchaeota archaeon]|nr:metallophosphoesterase [Candidatus Bathyarchaeota archaeon]
MVKNLFVGAVSDSHDNIPLIEAAVQTLNAKAVGLVLHAGDYVAPFTIAKFRQLNCPLIGVFGNNDGDHELLKLRFSETKNCTVHDRFTEVVVEGFRIALLHGHETQLLEAILNCGYFDCVVHGHSHNAAVEQRGKTLAVNPGELCGYLTGKPSIAIIDTEKKQATHIQLTP